VHALQLIDPVTGAPHPAKGTGGLTVCLPPDGAVITPDDSVIYDPPIMVWIGDAAARLVTVVPYGRSGDKTVQYPTKFGLTVPVLANQVMATGTTATIVMGQQAYKAVAPTGPTADTTTITADSTIVTADSF
jgi:hypothetical protein